MTTTSSIPASPWATRFRRSADASSREAFADRWLEERRLADPDHPVSARFIRDFHAAVSEPDTELRGEILSLFAPPGAVAREMNSNYKGVAAPAPAIPTPFRNLRRPGL